MKQRIIFYVIAAVFSGCSPKADSEITEEATELLSFTNDSIKKTEFIKGYETSRDNTRTKIAELKQKVPDMEKISQKEIEKKIKVIEEKHAVLENKINQLRSLSFMECTDMKGEIDSVIASLNEEINKIEKEQNDL